jgi:poly-beta-1,6-N-acetyl-D-glucosamine synthase
MSMAEILFWTSIIIIFYTYLGYGIILFLLVKFKQTKPSQPTISSYPKVTVLVAAYNEADLIAEKIENTLSLSYPENKINYLFVTDGSNDGTPDIVKQFSEIELLHKPEREGKIKAVQRAMERVATPIVIFTDANSFLNKEAIVNIVRHYQDESVGAVAGEKRIWMADKDNASSSGEGIYWKYESLLKKLDSQLYSVVGAAGELFSIRTDLYEHIPEDTIIEDFYQTLRIAQKGYRVKYEPEAYAMEKASISVHEELKRKIRISAGGLQAISRLTPLLNIFKYKALSFQYISHRVLRWTITPLCLLLLFLVNTILAFQNQFYFFILVLQLIFYGLALLGYFLSSRQIKLKFVFVPYYFFIMNYSVFAGFFRIIRNKQSAIWEKAKRA